MTTTGRLGLVYLSPQQSQKHVTVNEALRRLDAIVQLVVVSDSTSAQPGAPADGDCYILPAGKTGADWGSMTDYAIAYYVDGAWSKLTPKTGWAAYVLDTARLQFFDGTDWANTIGFAGDITAERFLAETSAYQYLVTPINNEHASAISSSFEFQFSGVRRAAFGANNSSNHYNVTMFDSDGTYRGEAIKIEYSTGTSMANAIYVKTNTYVGIGKTGPVCKLDVEGPVRVKSYAKASLPSASAGAGQMIYVTDEAGGAVIAFSDGTNWRRMTDRAVVS